jgi:hypothetical protein
MNAQQIIEDLYGTADYVGLSYLNDLSDAEWMRRPHARCNHINWQVGHLIQAEHEMIEAIAPGSMPPLPAGFAEKYARETQGIDDPSKFLSKAELLAAHAQQRAATKAVLARMSESDLDRATGVDYAPTVGSMLSLQGSHWLMHAGQWVIVRRELGKPILI